MITAVLLAAGSARRFDGSQKLLALVPTSDGPAPLVRLSVSALLDAGLTHVVVVIGRDADGVRASLAGLDVRFVINEEYATGLSSSLRIGVSQATRVWPTDDALLIALGDQPLTGSGVLESILRTVAERGKRSIVAPRFRGELGNPVLFPRAVVPELLEVSGDRGARGVVERDQSRVHYVDFESAMPPDVDTVSDLAVLTTRSRSE
ncbi:MAG TPA: nucleotidyltransferase family protein [Gemmatimonadaceae bacterium]|nr:nucleotidyltransferase family protein [Gemmatimonadaceae bacterium]